MSRRHVTFDCREQSLAGTLDEAPGTAGLLMVGGGNEIRSGAFAGQARLAAEIAAAGHPVFRFDRRGIGDSEGNNRGYCESEPDIRAALASFRALVPGMARVVGFGNCDGATALMLAGGAGCDGLVLSNPWTMDGSEEETSPPPATAIRARYVEKLRDPREIGRLLSGGVDIRKLLRGIIRAAKPEVRSSSMSEAMRAGLASFSGPTRLLLAERDRTAQIFAEIWDPADRRIARCKGAGHAFAEPEARIWLRARLLEALND